MRILSVLVLSISCLFAVAQGKAPTPEEAANFVQHEARADIFKYAEGSYEYKLLENHKKGEIIIKGRDIYKIESFQISRLYVCSYIFLDGNKLSEAEIHKLQKKIKERHENGESFKDLIREYSMDSNPDADNFRFVEGEVDSKFLNSVRNNEPGKAYSIDIPEEKWYYVALNKAGDFSRKMITASRYYYPGK
jgi:parvulin-like peptidyl-prolyl isomerase